MKRLFFALISLIGITNNLFGEESDHQGSMIRILNLSDKRVVLQQGEVNILGRWSKRTPQKFSLESGCSREMYVPSGNSYCLYGNRKLNSGQQEPNIIKFFSKNHSSYVYSVIAAGATVVVTSELSDSIVDQLGFNISDEKKADMFKDLDSFKSNIVGIVKDMISNASLESENELYKILLKKIEEGALSWCEEMLSFDDIQGFASNVESSIVQYLLADLLLESAKKYGPKWIVNLIDKHPFIIGHATNLGCIHFSKAAWLKYKCYGEKYVDFLKSNRKYFVKKVILTALSYGAYYSYKTSPYASVYFNTADEEEYEDCEIIEIVIKNYGDNAIKIDTL